MRILPKKISFEPFSFLRITRRKNKDILEFLLVEFEIYLPIPSVHSYLLAKALKHGSPLDEIDGLYEAFKIVEYSPELMAKMAEVESALVREEGTLIQFDDLMVASSAIITGSLLVVDDELIEKYEPFVKYGLKFISHGRFLEKIESLAREEEARVRVVNGR